ncbi:AAA-domain-containing protein [Eremomyces bilateralis CBS 781.70]|uniref:Vesicular-fusion protein SEC18 n=1 Tax=Eremomyces bilateralis CBS 781.70 TaxID=1392243 RepID=A0A6G1GDP0_9PEZI|nr:AAA-domain-containing protein [Eremomyces bilateralis CBS 781.70]KAF1816134.1 AAA-domain-containing protein [Eremomyces bilateralis CBS 781.70]
MLPGYRGNRPPPSSSNSRPSESQPFLDRPDPRYGAQQPPPGRYNNGPSHDPNAPYRDHSPAPTYRSRDPRQDPYNEYQNHPPSRSGGGGGGGMTLRPVKSPGGNEAAFSNIALVSPADFGGAPGKGARTYILLNGRYVLTAEPSEACQPGTVGLTDAQRTWAEVSIGPNDTVGVERYDVRSQGAPLLASADVEIGFATAKKQHENPYDQDELTQAVIKSFRDQFLAPGQGLLLNHKNIPLRILVRGVQLLDISTGDAKDEKGGEKAADPRKRGIVNPSTQFNFFKEDATILNLKASMSRPAANSVLQPNFEFGNLQVGGLDKELGNIFRRAFSSRIFPQGVMEALGITHVKGILLYGPPGTGKTLLARELGRSLNAHSPKIVNGPEILNSYVGKSEENVRNLFVDAEKEWKEKKSESKTHLIIFDEIDAICKQRGSGVGGGTGVGDSIVNQLLSKMDGVDQLNNILVVGMTNRRDLLDDALLRPGRFDVQVEIGLPSEDGREQILEILTRSAVKSGRFADDISLKELARITKNFSGAELAALYRAAGSIAMTRHVRFGRGESGTVERPEDLTLTMADFLQAFENDVKPAHGLQVDELDARIRYGIIPYSPRIKEILTKGRRALAACFNAESGKDTQVRPTCILLHGLAGAGTSALASRMALDADVPLVKFVGPTNFIGYGAMQTVGGLQKAFNDAARSKQSIIVLDDIEGLIEWFDVGMRYSTQVLAALMRLLTELLPKGHRLAVIGTTRTPEPLKQLRLWQFFQTKIDVPYVSGVNELAQVLRHSGKFSDRSQQLIHATLQDQLRGNPLSVGIRDVFHAVEMASDAEPHVFADVLLSRVQEDNPFLMPPPPEEESME